MKIKEKLLKLAKTLIHFAEVQVGDQLWIYEGELEVGVEVFVEDENGDMQPVADGEYMKDNIKIEVKGGVIESMETEEEPIEEPVEEFEEVSTEEVDEKDLRIQELETLLQEKDVTIEELTNRITELEEQINKPVEEPVKMAKIAKESKEGDRSGALKYFK